VNISSVSRLINYGFAIIPLLILPTISRADDVLFNNSGGTTPGMAFVSSLPANSFSTGSSAELLDNVVLDLRATNPADAGYFNLYLGADNATSPGAELELLATVEDSSLTVSPALYTYSGQSYYLDADTRYWIELVPEASTTAKFGYNNDDSGTGLASEFYSLSGNVYSDTSGPFKMEVTGTPVAAAPEPSSLLLLVSGAASLFSFMRRRSARIM